MKNIKCLISSILLCLIVFLAVDFIQFKFIEKQFMGEFEDFNINPSSYFKYYDNNWFGHSITSYKNYYQKLSTRFRGDIISKENINRPILLFGCSFAFGCSLEEEQTFAYKISTLTKRNIYNKALEACGIQHLYYLLTHKEFYDTLPQNPEYAVYVYIASHLDRLNNYIFPNEMTSNGAYLHYELKDNNLKLRKELPILYKSFLIKKVLSKIDEKNSLDNTIIKEKIGNLAVKLFIENKKLLQEKYPDIKFVILRYYSDGGGSADNEMPDMWKKLENEGFIILNSMELIGRIFTVEDTVWDRCHPSEDAWEELIPQFLQKLNL